MDKAYLKKLVIARLKTIPPNISFSVGSYGDYTRDELIREVKDESPVGKEFTEIEIQMLIDTPKIVRRLSEKAASSY